MNFVGRSERLRSFAVKRSKTPRGRRLTADLKRLGAGAGLDVAARVDDLTDDARLDRLVRSGRALHDPEFRRENRSERVIAPLPFSTASVECTVNGRIPGGETVATAAAMQRREHVTRASIRWRFTGRCGGSDRLTLAIDGCSPTARNANFPRSTLPSPDAKS